MIWLQYEDENFNLETIAEADSIEEIEETYSHLKDKGYEICGENFRWKF
jgi:hypothetical protein